MFDKVLLLAAGRTAYYGDAAKAIDWFESIGYPSPAHVNPGDFCLDLLATGEAPRHAARSTKACAGAGQSPGGRCWALVRMMRPRTSSAVLTNDDTYRTN